MIRFLVFFTVLFVFYLEAIEIEVHPDRKTIFQINEEEKNAIQNLFYRKYRFRMSEKGSKNLIKENRILANIYLKKYGLNSKDKAKIKIETELYLANRLVKVIQKSIKISEDVLLSYYMDHKKDFKNEDKVNFVSFIFPNVKSAMDFYLKNKDKSLEDVKIDKNVNKKEYIKSVKELKPYLIQLIKEYQKGFLPPLIGRGVSVIYIKSYVKGEGYKSFEAVKETIKNILYKKTFLQERNRILKQYQD